MKTARATNLKLQDVPTVLLATTATPQPTMTVHAHTRPQAMTATAIALWTQTAIRFATKTK